MSEELTIPKFEEPVCTSGQVARILGLPRPTLTGWVNRYEWLGISGVRPGSTRLFSPKEIGLLATIRMVIAAGNMTDAMLNSLDIISTSIEQQFDKLFSEIRLEEWGIDERKRPYLPILSPTLRLVCRDFNTPLFTVLRSISQYDEEPIRDLANYPFPSLTIPLGQALRNAWIRTLFILDGHNLED